MQIIIKNFCGFLLRFPFTVNVIDVTGDLGVHQRYRSLVVLLSYNFTVGFEFHWQEIIALEVVHIWVFLDWVLALWKALRMIITQWIVDVAVEGIRVESAKFMGAHVLLEVAVLPQQIPNIPVNFSFRHELVFLKLCESTDIFIECVHRHIWS